MFEFIGPALSAIGGLFSGSSAQDAAEERAAQERQIVAERAAASRFRPVGVTTGSPFGSANYGYDAQGNLTSAGYTPSAFIQGAQGSLQGAAPGMLSQFTGSMGATAPMGQAAQSMFGLGQGYLGTSPQEQAAKYMAQQQQLVAPGQQAALDELRARQQATGRGGLSIGGGVEGMGATNPEQAAYWNARLQQEREMAARADQGGQQYAQFGAGMVGSGGSMLRDMYGTQTASAAPWQTAMQGMQYTDELARQPMQQGMDYGRMLQPGREASAGAYAQGMSNAAGYQAQADAFSPWGALLQGAGGGLQQYGQQQQQQQNVNAYINALGNRGGMMGNFGQGPVNLSRYSGGIDDAAMAYGDTTDWGSFLGGVR